MLSARRADSSRLTNERYSHYVRIASLAIVKVSGALFESNSFLSVTTMH